MSDKKMTQKRALEIAINMMNEYIDTYSADVEDAEEWTEALSVISAMLDKKNEVKPRKVDEQTLAFRSALTKILADAEGPLTNKELQEELQKMVDAGELALAPTADGSPTTKVSPQRVANNMKVLEKTETVVRIRGEKASDKDSFTIA